MCITLLDLLVSRRSRPCTPPTRSRRSHPRSRPAHRGRARPRPRRPWPAAAPRRRARAWSCRPPCPTRCPTAPCSASATRPPQTALEASGLDDDARRRGRVGQHHRRPQDPRGVPRRRHRRRLGRRHPAAVRAVDRHRRQDHRRPRDGRPARAPDLRARHRARRRRHDARGPRGQVDRLQPRPGPGRAGPAGAGQGRADPGRRRAGRDGQRRRRLRRSRSAASRSTSRRSASRWSAATWRSTSSDGATHHQARGARRRVDALHARPPCSRTPTRRPPCRTYVEVWAKAQQWISEQPRRVRAGLLRRARGPLARGRERTSSTALGDVRGADQLGRRHRPPPGDRRPAREGAGPRAARRRGPLRPPLREGDRRRRSEAVVSDRRPRAPRSAATGVDERVRAAPAAARDAGSAFGFWIGPVAAAGAVVRRLGDRPARRAHPERAVDRRRRPPAT